ncbi:MAG: hypothetical protein DRP06_00100 [Candidatus Aenigmatarchaeota archaeon]|nr:MAG: hypothetical protein DRP06_00100 [Candidatus Aenigmarchaeota archaeon]
MVNLVEYKTQRIEELLGVNLNYLNEVPVLSDVGQDVINTAKYILETSYDSMDKLAEDLIKLKSGMEDYLLWD